MQLFPAIDLRGGQVVRLTQGDYDRMTVYGQDPCAQARSFVAAGAKNLHVVDLDGAKDGILSNYDTIAALAKQGGLYIEVGGGIRTEERIEKYLSLGVGRCILGSVAVTDFAFTARMLQKYGDKIAVGVDAKDGYVAIHGWKEVSAEPGVASVSYTHLDVYKRQPSSWPPSLGFRMSLWTSWRPAPPCGRTACRWSPSSCPSRRGSSPTRPATSSSTGRWTPCWKSCATPCTSRRKRNDQAV